MEHSIVYLRSAHTGSDTHSNRSSTWPNFPCLFNMSTVNAPEIFPILANTYSEILCSALGISQAHQMLCSSEWLYLHCIFILDLSPGLWLHTVCCFAQTDLSCQEGVQTILPECGRGLTLCPLFCLHPMFTPICWSRVDLRGLGCLCKRQDAQAWTEAGSRRQIWVLITSCTAWLFLAAATQKGPSKNRAFSRQTCSHKHISPGNINRRQKNVLGLCFPFLVPCASTSLSIAPSQVTISLCNAMREHHRH